ncbi:MAG: hypothetical protein HY825_15745 [Acidobacteria bacterium]|nr:hypothetical protein [Acidobacteriota bacterium]
MIAAAFLTSLAAARAASAEVTFTTVAPPGGFETAGIVSAVAHVPPAMIDPSKPFKEAMNRIYPDLTSQAQVRGADTVIITNIVILGVSDPYLLVYGTAVRTKGVPRVAAAAQGGASLPAAAPAPDTHTHADLSGTWTGKVLEEGETEPVDLTVNLMNGAALGEIIGGIILSDPGCEISINSTTSAGGVTTFKSDMSSKFR